MSRDNRGEVTQLLARWAQGDRDALDCLTPLVYTELRRIADGCLRQERGGHTLQPTALVNEAWLRLAKNDHPDFENRKRFFALAAKMMRNILVDYARSARAAKRGGDQPGIALPDSIPVGNNDLEQFLALDQALEQLAKFSPRQAQVVEMRYFGGLNVEEAADLLEVSAATISREQQSAEAWLSQAMSSMDTPPCLEI